MKTLKSIIAVVVVAVAALAAQPAHAQFRFGPKVGLNVNRLHLSDASANLDGNNRAGFNAGAMVEFTAPIIGVGVDVSAMYVRRTAKFMRQNNLQFDRRDYFEIPVNLKWKMNIPVVNNIIRPYLATGPSFAVLTSRKAISDFRNKKCDVAWNFGFGVELLKHVQVGASYGLGLTKAFETMGTGVQTAGIEGKNRYWTITAAYLF